jgi:hypothetical protein
LKFRLIFNSVYNQIIEKQNKVIENLLPRFRLFVVSETLGLSMVTRLTSAKYGHAVDHGSGVLKYFDRNILDRALLA